MGTPSLGWQTGKMESWVFAAITPLFWAQWSQALVWNGHLGRNLDYDQWHPQQALQPGVGRSRWRSSCRFQARISEPEATVHHLFLVSRTLWVLVFFLQRPPPLPHTIQKWCSGKWSQWSVSSVQLLGGQEPQCSMTMRLLTKSRSLRPSWSAERSESWSITCTVPTSPNLTFGFSLS